jgi:hypothetical protein
VCLIFGLMLYCSLSEPLVCSNGAAGAMTEASWTALATGA